MKHGEKVKRLRFSSERNSDMIETEECMSSMEKRSIKISDRCARHDVVNANARFDAFLVHRLDYTVTLIVLEQQKLKQETQSPKLAAARVPT